MGEPTTPIISGANPLPHFWRRSPVVVRAILTGGIVSLAGSAPWAILVSANTKFWSGVPWAVPLAALYLWLFWKYVRGAWWPRSTAESRRIDCRASRLTRGTWMKALFAGALGITAVILLQSILNRLVTLPHQQSPDISQYPFVTVVSCVIMSAIVAGVVEEASFRGYMQGPIERRYGPVIAILVTGTMFGFAHFTHPEVTLILMPYYLAVAAVYGGLAYSTNSILPGLVLHAVGNMVGTFDLFIRGRSEWQATANPKPLIWETGTDVSFWVSCTAFLVVGAGTVWAYIELAKVARNVPGLAAIAKK